MQRREDGYLLVFPPAIYEELKQRYTDRIKDMIDYATTDNQCRSRMLLRYFGEKSLHDCRQCDVCLERQGTETNKEALGNATQAILALLADRQPHHVSTLHTIAIPYPSIEAALQTLVNEEVIIDDDGMLSMKKGA